MAQPEQQEKTKGTRDLAAQAERSLKEANRYLKKAGDGADGAMAQLQQAQVLALLELADAIRSKG